MEKLDRDYWTNRYKNNTAQWDIGNPSTPIVEYIDQLTNKELKILIPGCGNSYEAEYLFEKGFSNVFLIDLSPEPIERFKLRNPKFPKNQLIVGDFFEHIGEYDLILEQTFFCAINPSLRNKYVEKMNQLLKNGGKLVGLLFNCHFENEGPPFGGDRNEYLPLFESYFKIKTFDIALNSIPQRSNRELFIICSK
jgi:SAM-dependent methyltransferase